MLGNISKLVGSISGGVVGWLIARLGLPADLMTPDFQAALIVVLSGLFTFFFPPNRVR